MNRKKVISFVSSYWDTLHVSLVICSRNISGLLTLEKLWYFIIVWNINIYIRYYNGVRSYVMANKYAKLINIFLRVIIRSKPTSVSFRFYLHPGRGIVFGSSRNNTTHTHVTGSQTNNSGNERGKQNKINLGRQSSELRVT